MFVILIRTQKSCFSLETRLRVINFLSFWLLRKSHKRQPSVTEMTFPAQLDAVLSPSICAVPLLLHVQVSCHMLTVYWQLSFKYQFTNSCSFHCCESDLQVQQRNQAEWHRVDVGTARPRRWQRERHRLRFSSLKGSLPELFLARNSSEKFL